MKKMDAIHFRNWSELNKSDEIANSIYKLSGKEYTFSKKLVLAFSYLYAGHPVNKRTKNAIIKDIRNYLKIRNTYSIRHLLENLGMSKIPNREWVKKHRDIELSFKQYQNFVKKFLRENQENIQNKILETIKQCKIEIENIY